MKFCLILPPSSFLIDDRVFPLLGPLYLSSVLKKAGCEVDIVDLSRANDLPELDADVVGISATRAHFPLAIDLLHRIKDREPSCWIIIGGPHPTGEPEICLEAGFDQVVVGEGESAILKIAEGCRDSILEEPFLEDLDQVPFPDREAIDLDSYHYYLGGIRTTSMVTSRGCPFRCAFCDKTWGYGIRYRSPQNVLQEAAILKEMGYGGIQFYDDEMLLDEARDRQIFAGLARLGLRYRCFARANQLTDSNVRMLADTGCWEVLIGVESGSDEILKNIHKGTTREMNKRAIFTLKEYGIRVKAALIVGLPGESWESVRETESFVAETCPDVADFTVLTVMPKSDIWKHPERYDLNFSKSYSWYKGRSDQYAAHVTTSRMSSEEIIQAREYLEKKFDEL